MRFNRFGARSAALLLAFGLLSCVGAVAPTQHYRIVDLGPLGCVGNSPSNPTCAVGRMNNWCEVVGWDVPTSADRNQAFLWRPSANGPPTKTLLSPPQSPPAFTYNTNFVAHREETPQASAFCVLSAMPTLPPASCAASSLVQATDFRANDINDHGEVIGLGTGPRNEAIVWATHTPPAGSPVTRALSVTAYLTDLPTGGSVSEGESINDEEQISGASAVTAGSNAMWFTVYEGMRDLSDLAHTGPNRAQALSIAEGGGHIAGVGTSPTGDHAAYWNIGTPNTPALDLGDLPGGANTSRANAVSRWGVVVGQGAVPMGGHAFRWTQATGMQDLGDLAGGAEASSALDIRDTWNADGSPQPAGDIVGFGTNAQGQRAVAWQSSTAGMSPPIDLSSEVNANDPLKATAILEQATSINRIGVIAVRGRIGNVVHVFLLVPADADVADASGMVPYRHYCTDPYTDPQP